LNLRVALSLATACVAGYALYASSSWPFRTALFPRVIGLPILFLALIELALSVWGREKEREGHAVDFQLTDTVEPALARKRTIAIISGRGLSGAHSFGWLSSRSSNLCFCLFKIAGREPWTLTIALTAISGFPWKAFFKDFISILSV
jgi:hypothetical protein